MAPRTELLAQRLALITGWSFIVLFGITTITAVPVGAGVVGAVGSLLLAVLPGASLVFGIKAAFLGDRFWWYVSMYSLSLATLIVAAVAFTGSLWAILTLPGYLFTLFPLLALKRTGRPDLSSEPNARYYTTGYLVLLFSFLFLVWANQLVG